MHTTRREAEAHGERLQRERALSTPLHLHFVCGQLNGASCSPRIQIGGFADVVAAQVERNVEMPACKCRHLGKLQSHTVRMHAAEAQENRVLVNKEAATLHIAAPVRVVSQSLHATIDK